MAKNSGISLWKLIGIFFLVVIGLNAIGLMTGILSAPFQMAKTVVNQTKATGHGIIKEIINPEQAMRSYRQIHGYYTAINAKVGKIKIAEKMVERASEGRKDARLTELSGLQQGCINDVERYNELTRRTDTRIYMNPEEYLPDSWSGARQILPKTFDQSVCLGE